MPSILHLFCLKILTFLISALLLLSRANTVTLTDQKQYPDDLPGNEDAFSREPFVVRFKAPKTIIKEFVLIPQHTTPTNTTKELDSLYDVLQWAMMRWKTQNVMLLGDFNADCGYLAKKNRKHVRIITDTNLFWLISDDTDTTVRESTSCSYDRIVVNGASFKRAVVPNSAKPFNFQEAYKLTEDEALDVSDHYPVEVLLNVAGSRAFGVGNSIKVSWRKPLQSIMLFSFFVFCHFFIGTLTD